MQLHEEDLVPPTPSRHLLLYLSVSDIALGYMLAQLDDLGNERAIYYLSKRMLDYEMRYVMIERFCLALVWATRRLRHYMTEYSVHLISRLDHMKDLFGRPALVGRLMRWSIVADHLALLPISNGWAIDDDFPDEDVVTMTSLLGWHMYFDGAANHSGYEIGLETSLELGIRQMEVFGDSNPFVDALATLASMIDIPADTIVCSLLIESRSVPTYCCLIDETELDDG
ncbi:hypothetical protein CK203_115387 [Vitis vinifera]|uniref:Reverse transcriptase RNase H-like domain-containing protein n=1 Tax=Vitis vinifera TaxID=29760 RepID=A0A438FFK9_VITVI|nr:hypothetical protein CK203_115387 [Vitis vinifera]